LGKIWIVQILSRDLRNEDDHTYRSKIVVVKREGDREAVGRQITRIDHPNDTSKARKTGR
jgi:hypothetical protein